MSIYLGVDTSNYTTSVAAVGDCGMISKRRLLEVAKGQRGLRQSDAVFLHMKALPDLFESLFTLIDPAAVRGIGVSTRPRNVEGSYMPVFLTGEGYARTVAAVAGVPIYRFSHQDGHIMAGIFSGGFSELLEKSFLSLHLSGGTTEILLSRYNGSAFDNQIVGGTKDISAGQLIDRIGVLLGMRFPCGGELEALSQQAEEKIRTKISVNGGTVNFSGAETAFMKMISTHKPADIALAVFEHVAGALGKMLNDVISQTKIDDVLIVGGVASNAVIRDYLDKNVLGKLYFAPPEYATDNAVGVAALTQKGGE